MTQGGGIQADWIAVDWGTSNLRVWAMSEAGAMRGNASSFAGMASLQRDGYEAALLDLVAPWMAERRIRVVACGMVGSRQGWIEAPYVATPCTPLSAPLVQAPTSHPLLDVRIVPGVRQDDPADVMRGEETQIAGYLAQRPGWSGVICLPGTHTKWARVSAGRIMGFRTFMTGELFATLAGQTVLRHTVPATGWDADGFAAACTDTTAAPETLSARLFSLRAEDLLTGLDGGVARARLSGLLIGAELAAALAYWQDNPVAIIGDSTLAQLYAQALNAQQISPATVDGPEMTRAGLTAAYTHLKETA